MENEQKKKLETIEEYIKNNYEGWESIRENVERSPKVRKDFRAL